MSHKHSAVVTLAQNHDAWDYLHLSKVGQRRTALNQTLIIGIPCPLVDLPREATPLLHCRFEEHKAQPSHVDPREGLQFDRVRQELPRKGGDVAIREARRRRE